MNKEQTIINCPGLKPGDRMNKKLKALAIENMEKRNTEQMNKRTREQENKEQQNKEQTIINCPGLKPGDRMNKKMKALAIENMEKRNTEQMNKGTREQGTEEQ